MMKRFTLALLTILLPTLASAQTLTLSPVPWQTFLDTSGNPVAGGCLRTYAAGGTTPQSTFTDSAGSVANTNPIELDSAGRVPSGFYLSPTSYRFDLFNAGTVAGCGTPGALIRSQDNIRSISPFANLDIAGTAGQSIAAGDVVYLSNGSGALTAGRWYKADSTNAYSSSTAVSVGMAPSAISSGVSGTIRLSGSVTMPSASLTTGTDYYASGTPGVLTSTAPTNSRLIGRADTTQTIILSIQTITPTNQPLGCQGRLTLTTGLAVTVADVTAAATIYYTPYKGDRCSLYDGAQWQTVTFTEKSLALGTDTTGFNYDLFGYLSSSTLAIERLVWTNDTTRATTLTLVNGMWTKTGDATRLYLGTYRTTGAGQTEDSFAKRFAWNNFNRLRRPMRVVEATDSWVYSTATIRQANASTANQLAVVVGLAEVPIEVEVVAAASSDATTDNAEIYVGQDSTTTATTGFLTAAQTAGVAGMVNGLFSTLTVFPSIGYHFYAWLERPAAVGATTWVGDGGSANTRQSGIQGWIEG